MRDLKWEQKYEEFEEHMGMLEFGSTLYNWKHTQLSKGHDDLDAKIAKEIEENEMMTLKSSMISSSSGSRLSVASIAAIILGIVALTLAAIKVRR